MRQIKHIFSFVTISLLMLWSVGCRRLPLEVTNYAVSMHVEVDVKARLNIHDTLYNPNLKLPEIEPQMFRAIFYDIKSDKMISDNYISGVTKSSNDYYVKGEINIIPGKYNLLVYNFDTEVIRISDDKDLNTIMASTQKVSDPLTNYLRSKIKSEPIQTYPIVYEPDVLLVSQQSVDIPYHSDDIEIKTVATPIVDMYYLQVRVKGAQYVSSAAAVLSGFASSHKIGVNEIVTSDPISLYFPLVTTKDKDTDVLATYFCTFGKVPDIENVIEISFDIITVDGRIQREVLKISDAFETENAKKYHWILIDKEIEIEPPAPTTGGGGFEPSVDDWEGEHHEIVI